MLNDCAAEGFGYNLLQNEFVLVSVFHCRFLWMSNEIDFPDVSKLITSFFLSCFEFSVGISCPV